MAKHPKVLLARSVYSAPAFNGLYPVQGRLLVPSQPLEPITLQVSMGGETRDFPIPLTESKCTRAGSYYFDFSFVLNTFRFSTGHHQIRFVVDGVPRSSIRQSVFISNSSTLGQSTREALKAYDGCPWIWNEGEIDSRHFPVDAQGVTPWFDRADAEARVGDIASLARLDDEHTTALKLFVQKGYCVLPFRADSAWVDALNGDLDRMCARGEIQIRDGADHRLEFMHKKSRAAHAIWKDPRILRFLSAVFQQRPLPCQTLVFLRGSEQATHQDTIHLTPFPAGYMCGVWIALEDITADSGPLVVLPGSHRAPRLYTASVGMSKVRDANWQEYSDKFIPQLERMLNDGGYTDEVYLPKKGDILVWHENLAHGGSARKLEGASRRSMVSHYFSEGSAYWYDATGRTSGLHDDSGGTPLAHIHANLRIANALIRGRVLGGVARRLRGWLAG